MNHRALSVAALSIAMSACASAPVSYGVGKNLHLYDQRGILIGHMALHSPAGCEILANALRSKIEASNGGMGCSFGEAPDSLPWKLTVQDPTLGGLLVLSADSQSSCMSAQENTNKSAIVQPCRKS